MKCHAVATDLNSAQDILENIEVGQNKRKRPSQGRGITENTLLKNHGANSWCKQMKSHVLLNWEINDVLLSKHR